MIKSLTSLRGIFILFIFLHHAGVYVGGGSMAVAFFFVVSGKKFIFAAIFDNNNYIKLIYE